MSVVSVKPDVSSGLVRRTGSSWCSGDVCDDASYSAVRHRSLLGESGGANGNVLDDVTNGNGDVRPAMRRRGADVDYNKCFFSGFVFGFSDLQLYFFQN